MTNGRHCLPASTGHRFIIMSLPISLISTDFDGTLFAEFESPPVPDDLQDLIAAEPTESGDVPGAGGLAIADAVDDQAAGECEN